MTPERLKQIELLLTHPRGVGLKWRRLLIKELVEAIETKPDEKV